MRPNLLSRRRRNAGISIGDHTFTDLDYADDVVLFLNHRDQFVEVLKSTEQESAKLGLHLS